MEAFGEAATAASIGARPLATAASVAFIICESLLEIFQYSNIEYCRAIMAERRNSASCAAFAGRRRMTQNAGRLTEERHTFLEITSHTGKVLCVNLC